MEEAIQERVVGQDHVVSAISDAVRISRAGLQAPNRPVASFLFLGPTGVGKVACYRSKPSTLLADLTRFLDGNVQILGVIPFQRRAQGIVCLGFILFRMTLTI